MKPRAGKGRKKSKEKRQKNFSIFVTFLRILQQIAISQARDPRIIIYHFIVFNSLIVQYTTEEMYKILKPITF